MASHEDQLLTAVQDKMDPITLLVWCEQNLGPKELPTLNKLLKEDDGTLAQEIGWNLLEMILPMLKEDHQEASRCLESIARRGNPREVIVKVAEVLEKLGEETDFSEDDADSVDELPTFAGEADRIHLGTLTLDGMPAVSDSKPAEEAPSEQKSTKGEPFGHSVSLATIQFESLMSMLALLHIRIKTQYPSRFLATSLPAALGAFRRIGVTSLSTMAFLLFLEKLSGRRPQLPPRALSVTATVTEPQIAESSAPPSSQAVVSLPDSEPEVEGSSMQQASQNEKDIVLRLLRAVLLEALDDYMASLQSRDPSYMSWTTRLRENYEPHRIVPGKPTECQKWKDSKQLSERDRVIGKFLTVGKDLKFDVDPHFKDLVSEGGQLKSPSSEEDDPESPSDYPTKPSQVPFPPSGMLFLCAAQQFSSHTAATSRPETDEILASVSRAYQFFRSDQNAAYLHASFATEDALLSLLYLVKDKQQSETTSFDFKSFFMSLAAFCAEFPDPLLRDAAHGIATTLFHNYPDVTTKLNIIAAILKSETTPVSLKAVAIRWVQDEISRPSLETQRTAEQSNVTASDLETDPILRALLFPETREYDIAELSYYIASLNLIFVLASRQAGQESRPAMQAAVADLEQWRTGHRGLEDALKQDDESSEMKSALDKYHMDLCALDDALGRSSEALKRFSAS